MCPNSPVSYTHLDVYKRQQFGPKVTPGKLRAAMKALGFADVFEVAIGADLCAKQEAEDFLKAVSYTHLDVYKRQVYKSTTYGAFTLKTCKISFPTIPVN